MKKIFAILFLSLIILFTISIDDVSMARKFQDFSTNPLLYCVNRGKAFSKNDDEYGYSPIVQFTINGNAITSNPYPFSGDTYNLSQFSYSGTNEQKMKLYKYAYIILNDYSNKHSIGGSPNQVAMWRITNPNDSLPSTSDSFIVAGNNLRAEAEAYANWISSYSGQFTLDGSNAVVENGYIGPFKLTYTPRASGTYNGITKTYGNISMKLGGTSITSIYTKSNDTYTKLGNMQQLQSGANFYVKEPQNTTGDSITLKISQEGKISAEFEIYHSNKASKYYSTSLDGKPYQILPEGDEIFCMNCMQYHTRETRFLYCYYCGNQWGHCEHTATGVPDVPVYVNTACQLVIIENPIDVYNGSFLNGDGEIVSNRFARAVNELGRQNILKKISASQTTNSKTTTVALIHPLTLTLNKQNNLGESIEGAEFTVSAVQDGQALSANPSSLTIGSANITITPNSTSDITVTIHENSLTNYCALPKDIIIVYKYENGTWKVKSVTGWTGSSGTYTSGQDKFTISNNTTITIKNRPKTNFEFTKIDDLTNLGIQNVKFNIQVENLGSNKTAKIAGTVYTADSRGRISLTGISTNASGKISFEDIEFALNGTTYKTPKITLTETEVPTTNNLPNYKFLDGPIVVEIEYKNGKPQIKSCTYNGTQIGADDRVIIIDTESVAITAKNTPIIHLGGRVWLDTPQGTKPVNPPNGEINSNEKGIKNIPIYLFKTVNGGKSFSRVTQDVNGNTLMTETVEKDATINYPNSTNGTEAVQVPEGTYFLGNLPKLKNGYYIIFYSYDGENYIATIDGANQKANEQVSVSGQTNKIRSLFDNRLQTIINGQQIAKYFQLGNTSTISMKGFTTSPVLTYDTYNNANRFVSVLKTTSDYSTTTHTNGTNVNSEFIIFSKTKDNYNTTNTLIHFGLQQRELDLCLVNDVYQAEVSINGKTTIYTCDDIVNGNGANETTESTGTGTRDGSSTGREDGTGKTTKGDNVSYSNNNKYELKLYKSDFEYRDSEASGASTGRTSNLRVVVTYEVELVNQNIVNLYNSNEEATVYEIKEYFDTNYNLVSAKYGNTNLQITAGTNITINGKTYKTATISKADNSAITGIKAGEGKIIYLQFEVITPTSNGGSASGRRGASGKDSTGAGKENENVIINLGEYANIAEITKYGTNCGLVDKDSAPGNFESNFGYEDDTDRAMGLVISVPEGDNERVRTISGNVWEDAKNQTGRDGKYKYGNGTKQVGEQEIQGIKVELFRLQGTGETKIAETITDVNGNYIFQDFIPGDYIVKFTYGDETYKAESYKSGTVKEEHYNIEVTQNGNWYYNSIYTMKDVDSHGNVINKNKAIDNAQERLKLIAEYSYVDKDTYLTLDGGINGNSIQQMNANTPKIFIAVDVNEFDDVDGTTNVEWDEVSNLSLQGVNFCIEKRPETKITLEEHIKRLSLKGNDGVAIIQAQIDNEDNLFNGVAINEHITGVKNGLRTTRTTRNSMGTWEIRTDISELVQGAEIETEIVYQIRNESEVDYLSTILLDIFESVATTAEYNNILNNPSDYLRYSSLYELIGKTYYTGIIDNTVGKTYIKVGKVQDYTNDLEFRNSFSFEAENNKTYKKATGTSGINLVNYTKIIDINSADGTTLQKDKATGKEIITAIQNRRSDSKVDTENLTVSTLIKTKNDIGKLETSGANAQKRIYATFGINGLTATGKLDFENYIAEIMSYSTPNGRVDENAVPGNLSDKYVYSDDKSITLSKSERDEYCAERITIGPPEGEDEINSLVLVISITSGILVIAAGTFAIKKYVIK